MELTAKWSRLFVNLFGVYLIWIGVFYFASHLHVHFCTPCGRFLWIFNFTPVIPNPSLRLNEMVVNKRFTIYKFILDNGRGFGNSKIVVSE